MATKEMTKKERREEIKAAKRAEKEAKAAETKTTVENTTAEQPKDEKKKPAEKPVEVKNQLPPEPLDCLRGLLEGWIQGWLPVKLIRRSILVEKNISWIEGLDMWEDMLLSAKVFAHAKKISSLNKALYHYRSNPDSIVNNVDEKRIHQMVDNVREIEIFLVKCDLRNNYFSSLLEMKARVKINICFSKEYNIRKKYSLLYSKDLVPCI